MKFKPSSVGYGIVLESVDGLHIQSILPADITRDNMVAWLNRALEIGREEGRKDLALKVMDLAA